MNDEALTSPMKYHHVEHLFIFVGEVYYLKNLFCFVLYLSTSFLAGSLKCFIVTRNQFYEKDSSRKNCPMIAER